MNARAAAAVTRSNVLLYGLAAGVVSLAGSLLLAGLASAAAHALGLADAAEPPPLRMVGIVDLLGIVVFAPLVETALLSGLIALLARVVRTPVHIAAIAALLWGALHGAFAPLWFFGTVWAFFVFSWAYLVWRRRAYRHAFAAAAIPHALQNATAWGLVALAGGA